MRTIWKVKSAERGLTGCGISLRRGDQSKNVDQSTGQLHQFSETKSQSVQWEKSITPFLCSCHLKDLINQNLHFFTKWWAWVYHLSSPESQGEIKEVIFISTLQLEKWKPWNIGQYTIMMVGTEEQTSSPSSWSPGPLLTQLASSVTEGLKANLFNQY